MSGRSNAEAGPQQPALEPLPLEAARRTRELFLDAGYREDELLRVLGVEDPPLVTQDDTGLRERTREPTPFNLLARLFFLGQPLDAALARGGLPEWFVAAATHAGLLEDAQGQLRPRALVVPSGRQHLACDLLDRLRSERGDHVPVGGPAARHLRNFTLRRPVASCLDLGTGNGVQALAAARHARRVVATDLNPRALDFARFNARLNGCEQIECRRGDGFAPVAGERFDLIVCNPPFVVTPSTRFLYRDNDMELDGFCRRLAREAPAHLAEGGVFQMIFEWVQLADQAWEERLLGWFEGSGCDVWLVKANTHLPESYARRRLDETARATGDGAAAGLGEWLDYYRERKVVALHGGFLALRRRAGGGWHRLDQLTGDVDASFGAAIGRGFAARDFLAAHGDRESLLASRLRLADGVGVEKRARWEGGGWRTSARLSLEGFAWSVEVDPAMADFLVHFDGARGLAELCQAVVSELGVAEEGVLGFVRSLLDRGLLVP
jgi:methylase of polypeptide subunit release factors